MRRQPFQCINYCEKSFFNHYAVCKYTRCWNWSSSSSAWIPKLCLRIFMHTSYLMYYVLIIYIFLDNYLNFYSDFQRNQQARNLNHKNASFVKFLNWKWSKRFYYSGSEINHRVILIIILIHSILILMRWCPCVCFTYSTYWHCSWLATHN